MKYVNDMKTRVLMDDLRVVDATTLSAAQLLKVLPADPIPLRPQAQILLDKSDVTMLRCVEAGVAVPVEWNSYRKALRAIATGSDMTSSILPTPPIYPAGT